MDTLLIAYLAGLFDGEGHVRLSILRQGRNLNPAISVAYTSSSDKLREYLLSVLNSQGYHFIDYFWKVKSNLISSSVKIRELHQLRLVGWTSSAEFLRTIMPYTIEKKAQITIALEACGLHKRLREAHSPLKLHVREFQELRVRLHALSRKGPRTIVDYSDMK